MEYGALILRKRKLFILKMRVLTRNEIYDILNTEDIVNCEDVLDFRSSRKYDFVNFVIDNIILNPKYIYSKTSFEAALG